MIKRLFFSIEPSKEEKDLLFNIIEEKKELLPPLSVNWVKKENIHITLLFLGSFREDAVSSIISAGEEAVKDIDPFKISFSRVCYHPLKGVPDLIWIRGETPEELLSLREKLEKIHPTKNDDQFLTHITLGRVKKWEFKKIEKEEIPDIEEDISFSITVKSVSLMESILKREGPQYKEVKSFLL